MTTSLKSQTQNLKCKKEEPQPNENENAVSGVEINSLISFNNKNSHAKNIIAE